MKDAWFDGLTTNGGQRAYRDTPLRDKEGGHKALPYETETLLLAAAGAASVKARKSFASLLGRALRSRRVGLLRFLQHRVPLLRPLQQELLAFRLGCIAGAVAAG